MAKQSGEKLNAIPVRNAVRLPASQKSLAESTIRTTAKGACDDCRATAAFSGMAQS